MFLIVTARNVDVTYMFLQWLGDLTHVKSINEGLDIFICSLKALHEQFVRNMIQNPIKYYFFLSDFRKKKRFDRLKIFMIYLNH